MAKLLSAVATIGLIAFGAYAHAQTVSPTPTLTQVQAHQSQCTSAERDLIKLQLDALKAMRSSVGQTAKDFCTALSKTEDDALKQDDDLISDVLALIKKHVGADIDPKSISKMCTANQDVPPKALDEQIKALESEALACQDSI